MSKCSHVFGVYVTEDGSPCLVDTVYHKDTAYERTDSETFNFVLSVE